MEAVEHVQQLGLIEKRSRDRHDGVVVGRGRRHDPEAAQHS
jgi:hypothetical protein